MLIYLITNLNNDKMYVGQTTVGLNACWQQHISDALSAKQSNLPIHQAIRKYGIAAFHIELLALTTSKEQLNQLERCWIILLQTQNSNKGYNCTAGGEDIKGWRHTAEARIKMSQFWNSPHQRQKLINFARLRGTAHLTAPEIVSKRAATQRGQIRGPNFRISAKAKLRVGAKNLFFGKAHSENVKLKNSLAHSGSNNFCFGKKRPEHAEYMRELWRRRRMGEGR